ncbi:Ctf8-domain-containing protein [Lentinula edodes]|uniref:Ctf8-domain-containing protein n=1 Tax=Lentinula edodes TaxID=5353 RepID=UPI001E8DFD26|nr:Ctf8-domain-containing protein [Lentinula edodes]KAH7868357.1 Ctf8-domain-containing protein [Lentinula edodes]
MLIPVTFDRHPSTSSLQKLPPSLLKISHDEVVLLDLQGALEVDSSHPNERDGKFIGTLTIDDDMKRSTLRIGHHLIEGKLVNLPKPLAVLHRSPAPVRISDSRWTGEDSGGDEDVVMDDLQWNTLAIVKRKIIFAKRPTPLAGRLN